MLTLLPGLGRVQAAWRCLLRMSVGLVLRRARTWMSSTGLGVVDKQPVLNQIDDKSRQVGGSALRLRRNLLGRVKLGVFAPADPVGIGYNQAGLSLAKYPVKRTPESHQQPAYR